MIMYLYFWDLQMSFAARVKNQHGITLVEIILVAAIVAAGIIGAFLFAHQTRVTAAVQGEQAQIETIIKTMDGLFAAQSNFQVLDTQGADYLKARASNTPLRFTTDSAGRTVLVTGLGGGAGIVALEATQITGPGHSTAPFSAYSLRYSGLSTQECIKLVTASVPSVTRGYVLDGDASLTSSSVVIEKGHLVSASETALASMCAQATNKTVLFQFSPARSFTATGTPSTAPAPQCAPTRETQTTACPIGQSGSITQERVGNCTGPNNSIVYSAWNTIEDTCQDAGVAPPDATPDPITNNCTQIDFTRTQACPAGQTGQVVQSRQHDTCTGLITPWNDVSTSCQAAVSPSCAPSTEQRTQACPSGQGGQIIQSRSSTCPSPTSVPAWSDWGTVSSTCTASCVANGTCCTVQREQRTTADPCLAGTYGASGQDQERFLGCVNATMQESSWTSWQTVSTSGSCTACPADTTETEARWISRTAGCAAGLSGSRTFEAEQRRTRVQSYSCPAGTTSLPSPSYTAWGEFTDTGAIRNEADSCTASALEMCSDGTPLLTAWYTVGMSDNRMLRLHDHHSYYYGPSPVVPTEEEVSRFQSAARFTPIARTETPGPSGFPPNWHEEAYYTESCGPSGSVGNIRFGHTKSFDCVDNMGMHYCDYNFYSGVSEYQVCRHACLSNLVGQPNYPFQWSRQVIAGAPPAVVCTGQPWCTATSPLYYPEPHLCSPDNLGERIQNVRWVHPYGTGGNRAYSMVDLTCIGPDVDPPKTACTVPAGESFVWTGEDPGLPSYSNIIECSASTSSAQTIQHGDSLVLTDSTNPQTGIASFKCESGVLSRIMEGGSSCAVTSPASCVIPSSRLFNWKTQGRFCSGALGAMSVPSGSTVTVIDNNSVNIALSPRQGQAQFACYNGNFAGIPNVSSCN